MKANYSQCSVRINRNACLENLLIVRRSAKIIARRSTVASSHIITSSPAQSANLFKKIANKPFVARRRSVCARKEIPQLDEMVAKDDVVVLSEVSSSNTVPKASDAQQMVDGTKNDEETVDATVTSSNAKPNDNSSLNDADANKENVASPNMSPKEDILFSFLPKVDTKNHQ